MFQVELEKLNKASEEINRLELELDVCFTCSINLEPFFPPFFSPLSFVVIGGDGGFKIL